MNFWLEYGVGIVMTALVLAIVWLILLITVYSFYDKVWKNRKLKALVIGIEIILVAGVFITGFNITKAVNEVKSQTHYTVKNIKVKKYQFLQESPTGDDDDKYQVLTSKGQDLTIGGNGSDKVHVKQSLKYNSVHAVLKKYTAKNKAYLEKSGADQYNGVSPEYYDLTIYKPAKNVVNVE